LQLAVCEWKQNQPLFETYIQNFAGVSELYDYHPWDPDVYEKRAEDLFSYRHLRADRTGLAEVLYAYNRSIGNAPQALNNIGRLAEDRALAVVGGQQAGLFTGPLFVVYKAITVIQAARQAEEKLRRPVIPVFWIAGEDHDLDEVNHIHALTPQLKVEKIRIETAGASPRIPVSRLRIPRSAWLAAIGQLDAVLMPTEYKEDLMGRITRMAEQSRTLSEFFARALAWLFGEYGLVFLDSDDPALRRLEKPMFRRIIEQNAALNEALIYGREKVERLGFQPQTEIREGQANLFVIERDERALLYRTQTGFTTRQETNAYSAEDLLRLAEQHPERLSNNVMTRPLMQEYLFPVLAAVLGPGEIAYWGLTRKAFHSMGMRMPVLLPRSRYTLVEGTLQKHMQKFGLSPEDILFRFQEKRQSWLERQDSLRLPERFARLRAQFTEAYRPLLDDIAKINPGLKKLGDTNMQKIAEQLEFMENRAKGAFASQFESSLRQMDRLYLSFLPLGKPQERILNIFPYLNKYGTDWLRELTESPVPLTGQHHVCYL